MVAIGTKGVQWMQLVKIGKKKKSCQIPLLVHCFLLNAAL